MPTSRNLRAFLLATLLVGFGVSATVTVERATENHEVHTDAAKAGGLDLTWGP